MTSSAAALSGVYARVVPTVPSAKLPNGQFGTTSGRRDGAGLVTPFSYRTACSCMAYEGAPRPTS